MIYVNISNTLIYLLGILIYMLYILLVYCFHINRFSPPNRLKGQQKNLVDEI